MEHIFEGTDFIAFDRLVIQYRINNRSLEYKHIKSKVKKKSKLTQIKLQTPSSVVQFHNVKTSILLPETYRTISYFTLDLMCKRAAVLQNGWQIYQSA